MRTEAEAEKLERAEKLMLDNCTKEERTSFMCAVMHLSGFPKMQTALFREIIALCIERQNERATATPEGATT